MLTCIPHVDSNGKIEELTGVKNELASQLEKVTRYISRLFDCIPLSVAPIGLFFCTHSEKMELERRLGQSITKADALAQEKKVMESNITLLEETQRNLKYVYSCNSDYLEPTFDFALLIIFIGMKLSSTSKRGRVKTWR